MPRTTISTPDPLHVLSSTARVIEGLTQVRIDQAAIDLLAAQIVSQQISPPAWDADTHFTTTGPDAIEQVAGWTFALDALNYCFWSQGDDPTHRWRIMSGDTRYDGYMALAIALRDAARAGTPVWDPHWMARVTDDELQRIFAPAPGSAAIPLMASRTRHLNELGAAVGKGYPGTTPFTDLMSSSECSAPRIARTTIDLAPSFDDVATWTSPLDGQPHVIQFHKRAQILASDLAGALEPLGLAVRDRDQLTAFADYKVPQVLRQLGILTYAPDLSDRIRRRHLIAAGSRRRDRNPGRHHLGLRMDPPGPIHPLLCPIPPPMWTGPSGTRASPFPPEPSRTTAR